MISKKGVGTLLLGPRFLAGLTFNAKHSFCLVHPTILLTATCAPKSAPKHLCSGLLSPTCQLPTVKERRSTHTGVGGPAQAMQPNPLR